MLGRAPGGLRQGAAAPMSAPATCPAPQLAVGPRLGFLGLGWIGRMRLRSLAEAGIADIRALADPDWDALREARTLAPDAELLGSLDELLDCELDGLVIATPSAQHADQSIAAMRRGIAVFCQKPFARTATEARAVVEAASRGSLPLGVDYCYRHLAGVPAMREAIRGGEIGHCYAAELQFHNAYGPDKPWFRDLREAGGGCLMDLGTHLLDLALWCLGPRPVLAADSRLFSQGRLLSAPLQEIEDYAALAVDLGDGTHLTLSCSWNLHAGQDAVIAARFYGTDGAFAVSNVAGSFYDFTVERMNGTATRNIASGPDRWGGRALQAWVRRLADGDGFDAGDELLAVPELIDRAYGRAGPVLAR